MRSNERRKQFRERREKKWIWRVKEVKENEVKNERKRMKRRQKRNREHEKFSIFWKGMSAHKDRDVALSCPNNKKMQYMTTETSAAYQEFTKFKDTLSQKAFQENKTEWLRAYMGLHDHRF